MNCPDCGTYAESKYCPNCGLKLQTVKTNKLSSAETKRSRNYGKYYLGDTEIDRHQFKELCQQAEAGEKLEVIKRIRLWTHLSLADAKHIADHFDSIDFSMPQTLIHVKRAHNKTTKTSDAVVKGVGLTALFSGYGIFRVISSLVKPYMGKRK